MTHIPKSQSNSSHTVQEEACLTYPVLLSEIPRALGFFPIDSLVVSALSRQNESEGHMGLTHNPIMRMNLDAQDPHELEQLIQSIQRKYPDAWIVAIVITSEFCELLRDLSEHGLSDSQMPLTLRMVMNNDAVNDILFTDSIHEAAPWYALYSHAEGTIDPVVSAPEYCSREEFLEQCAEHCSLLNSGESRYSLSDQERDVLIHAARSFSQCAQSDDFFVNVVDQFTALERFASQYAVHKECKEQEYRGALEGMLSLLSNVNSFQSIVLASYSSNIEIYQDLLCALSTILKDDPLYRDRVDTARSYLWIRSEQGLVAFDTLRKILFTAKQDHVSYPETISGAHYEQITMVLAYSLWRSYSQGEFSRCNTILEYGLRDLHRYLEAASQETISKGSLNLLASAYQYEQLSPEIPWNDPG